jgi:uncharacterized metal-binding protein YceD (DUF177 family)
MTPESVSPFSRPVAVHQLPSEGLEVEVEATPEECAAIAKDFKLPAVHALAGSYRLQGSPERVRVTGRVRARITQVCVVTLDPFESEVDEEVEVEFAAPAEVGQAHDAEALDADAPDPLVNGIVDLGALTAEFLALGLDPYPRKPGVAFDFEPEDRDEASPFAALGRLAGRKPADER